MAIGDVHFFTKVRRRRQQQRAPTLRQQIRTHIMPAALCLPRSRICHSHARTPRPPPGPPSHRAPFLPGVQLLFEDQELFINSLKEVKYPDKKEIISQGKGNETFYVIKTVSRLL